MNAFFHYMFNPTNTSWWNGAVYANLLADTLWAVVVIVSTRYVVKLLKRQHQERLDQQQLHHLELTNNIDLLHKRLNKEEL